MLYLLDANVLIDANRDYYPIDRVPEFWEWLADAGENDRVKIPLEVYEEIKEGDDGLAEWIKNDQNKEALLFDEDVDVSLVSRVTDDGYADDLSDDEVEKIGRDPFLVAHALADGPDDAGAMGRLLAAGYPELFSDLDGRLLLRALSF